MSDKFHERFKIKISFEEARKRFVHRVYNEIFQSFCPSLGRTYTLSYEDFK